MAAIGHENTGSAGGGIGGFGDLDWEKKTYFTIHAIVAGIIIVLCLGGCFAAGPEVAPFLGVAVFWLLIGLGFTWFMLFNASSCLKWPCMVLTGIQVLLSAFSVVSLPATLADDELTGSMKLIGVVGWFIGLAFNAWFVSILYRDLNGNDY